LPYEKVGKEERCIAEEVPFEIPDSWEWVRLVNISIIQEGAGIRSFQYRESGTQILTVTNILENAIDLEKSKKYISKEEYLEKYQHLTPNIGDIVTACSGGSWGKTAIFDKTDTMLLNTSTLRLRFFNDLANNIYLYYITKSEFFKSQLRVQLSGMQPNFGYAHYSKILIPLPPLEEQERIVAKIEELMPFVEEYDKVEKQNNELNKSFPDKLKKSILQDAVQGKLVPQNPDDEPACKLLKRIKAEKDKLIKEKKIKKDKNESYIFRRDNSHYEMLNGEEKCIDDEIPFDIPDSWEWVRLNKLGITLTENTPSKTHPEYFNGSIPFISPADILNYKINYCNQSLSDVGKKYGRLCNPGSILQVCIGGSIGKLAIVDRDIAFNQQINAISPILCVSYYLFIAMQSPYFYTSLNEKAGGTATPIINRGEWDKLLIPLPPVAEQERIVAKIEELLSKIERLTK